MARLKQASYATALVEQATETETPLPAVFALMLGLLRHLAAQPAQPQTLFAFELKLLRELGLQPNLERSELSPGTRQLVRALTENDWPLVGRLKLSAAQGTELRQFLHGFLIYHLGKIPRGRERAVMAAGGG